MRLGRVELEESIRGALSSAWQSWVMWGQVRALKSMGMISAMACGAVKPLHRWWSSKGGLGLEHLMYKRLGELGLCSQEKNPSRDHVSVRK